MTNSTLPKDPMVRLLGDRAFGRLWAGQVISQFGDGFYWLAIMLGISSLTGGRVEAVGLMAMTFLLPQLPVSLLGGLLVDRLNRRRLMVATDLARAGTTLGMMAAYIYSPLPWMYLLALVHAALSAVFLPAKNALIPQIVPRDDLFSANTLSQTTQVAALIVGPALAGWTIERAGVPVAFLVDALTFLVSAGFLAAMPPVPTPRSETSTWRSLRADLAEGLRFLTRTQLVRGATLVVSVLFLGLGAVNVLWVPYIQRIFGLGAQEIGLVDAMQGLGMFVGTVLFTRGGIRRWSAQALLLGSLFVVATGFVAIGLATRYAHVLAAVGAVGTVVPAAQASFLTLVQRATPNRLLGRVQGAVSAVTNAAMLASMALATGLAERIGLRESYLLCGLVAYLSVAVGLWALRGNEAPTY